MTLTLCDSISRQSPLAQIKFKLLPFRPGTSLLCRLGRGLSESMEHGQHAVCCLLVPCMSWLTAHLWMLSWGLHPIHRKMQGCTLKSQIYTLSRVHTAANIWHLEVVPGLSVQGRWQQNPDHVCWNYTLLTSMLEVNLSPFLWRSESLF